MSKQKTYLDFLLENEEKPKEKSIYFTKTQENAIIRFNSDKELTLKERHHLFRNVIEPALKKITSGVLEMKMFHTLGKINREELIIATINRLEEKLHKFHPNMIGKKGTPVKAYSYFSTIAKNFILDYKIKFERVQAHKADIESSIDISVLSEDNLSRLNIRPKKDELFEEYEQFFQDKKKEIFDSLETFVSNYEKNEVNIDADFLKVAYTLKYLIFNWHKIEFQSKNEFLRLLIMYTGVKQQKVAVCFKTLKDHIAPLSEFGKEGNRYRPKADEKESEEDEDEDIDIEALTDDEYQIILKEKEKQEKKSKIYTFEDFESFLESEENEVFKKQIINRNGAY